MSERNSRQSFLGCNSEEIINKSLVGIVGLGGGGSHIVQQLSHIGFKNYVLFDGDNFEESNINRLIGSTYDDIALATPKIEIAKRVISGIVPDANIEAYQIRWQLNPSPLKKCDLIFGCVDGFAERRELEILSRRYLIPYIDIGMDVHQVQDQPPLMCGQVILSMPGGPCMTCLDFLNETNLAKEAAKYGAVGIRPQVVWCNGVLASTAVNIAVNLLTGWCKAIEIYYTYDCNANNMRIHPRAQYLKSKECTHFPNENIGDPILKYFTEAI
jgi:hypothetical protein